MKANAELLSLESTHGEPRSLAPAEAHQCFFHVVDTFITWKPEAHASKQGFDPRDGVQRVAYESDDDIVSQTDSASSDELEWESASEGEEVKGPLGRNWHSVKTRTQEAKFY